MKGLNLAKFKKMKEDKDWATMIHEDGHTLMIAKAPLSHLQRKQLESLPVHNYAEGGDIKPDDQMIDYSKADYLNEPTPDNAPYGSGVPVAPPVSASPVQTPTADQVNEAASRAPSEAPAVVANPQSAPTGQAPFQTPQQAKIPGYEEEKAANIAGAGAVAQQGQQEAQALQEAQDAIQKLPSQSDIIAANKAASDKLFQAYQNKELDPDHYWQSHSKIAAGIGLLLSSAGQAIGSHGDNGALDAINRGISRDIDAQKNSQDQKMNLWKMNREALGSDLAANLATQNQLYTGLKFKIEQAAAQAKGPIAKANAQAANARIDQVIGQNNFHLSLLNPTSDNPDPATRVQFLVPPERQQKVFDEIDAAKETVANAPGILQAFDQAAKEVRPLTGGLGTSLTSFVPGMKSAGQSAMIARLGPTFKDIEGTVRQAAMDNMEHNTVPHFTDNDATIATKRASLLQYLTSKSAASTAKGFGIDLSRFPSTNTSVLNRMRPNQPSESAQTKGGVQYQKQIINGKAYMVPVK